MSVIDWSSRPEPWRWIGPQFRRDCERITGREPTAMPTRRAAAARSLAERREALGLTQMQFCAVVGLGICTISKAERDQATSRVVGLYKAALDRLEAERREPA